MSITKKGGFKPNRLRPGDVDRLEDWQLLCATTHFGPAMGDCVDLGYTYVFDEEKKDIVLLDHGDPNVSLKDDIDIEKPWDGLSGYGGLTWQDACRRVLRERLEERTETPTTGKGGQE